MLRFLLLIEDEELGDNVADMIACSTNENLLRTVDAIFECQASLQRNSASMYR